MTLTLSQAAWMARFFEAFRQHTDFGPDDMADRDWYSFYDPYRTPQEVAKEAAEEFLDDPYAFEGDW